MLTKLKKTFQTLVCAALVIQLGGCIFVDRDRHGHRWHHDNGHDYDSGFDIRVHGE